MLSKIASYWTWKVQLGVAAAALFAGWWYMGIVKTMAYEEGARDMRPKILAEVQAEQQKVWDAERLNTVEQQQRAERAELDRVRGSISRQLTTTLNAINAQNLEDRNNVATTSSVDLVPNIRSALGQLDAIEYQRTLARPAPGPSVQR